VKLEGSIFPLNVAVMGLAGETEVAPLVGKVLETVGAKLEFEEEPPHPTAIRAAATRRPKPPLDNRIFICAPRASATPVC